MCRKIAETSRNEPKIAYFENIDSNLSNKESLSEKSLIVGENQLFEQDAKSKKKILCYRI